VEGLDPTALTRASSFIFRGVVQEAGASNVRGLEPTANLLLVRVDAPLRSDPALGDMTGRVVTLATDAPDQLPPATDAVFFANGWIHSEEVAVRELAHASADLTEAVRTEVARLPDLHLLDRLAQARLVVLAEVQSTSRLRRPRERRAPNWARAQLKVLTSLKGRAREPILLFPTSDSHHWFRAKRPRKGQRRVFILHAEDEHAQRWLNDSERGVVFTALDQADIQPEAQLDHLRALLREARS
jgi:hypothetical protein